MMTLERDRLTAWLIPTVTLLVGFTAGLALHPSRASSSLAAVEPTACREPLDPVDRADTDASMRASRPAAVPAARLREAGPRVVPAIQTAAANRTAKPSAAAFSGREAVVGKLLEDASAALDLDEGTRELLVETFEGVDLRPGADENVREKLRDALGDRGAQAFDAYMRERASTQVRYQQRSEFLGVAMELGLDDAQLPGFEKALRDRGLVFSSADEIDARVRAWDRDGGDGGVYDEERPPEEIAARIHRQLEGLGSLVADLSPTLDAAQRRRLERWIEHARWERAAALVALESQDR